MRDAMRPLHRRSVCKVYFVYLLYLCGALLWWASCRVGRVSSFALPSNSALEQGEAHGKAQGPGMLYEMIGEYTLPKPVVVSPRKAWELWMDLGVGVRKMEEDTYVVAPQHFSKYRSFGQKEAMYLRDMQGNTVSDEENPGIRIELDVVTETEEANILSELQELVDRHGYEFTTDASDDAALAASWRLTGRDEKRTEALAPWGWGSDFDKTKLPPALRRVVSKLEELPGYPLGPIRDVTVNMRSTDDYQMVPHIDPLGDGPNTFVLSLLSSAVVTFSPLAALRAEAERANDDEHFAQHSYTDEDIDCLVPRRAAYSFTGNARYLWTHAVRPSVRPSAEDPETFERWGTWEKVLRRQPNRAAIIFSFADEREPHTDPASESVPSGN
ncbi:gsp-2 [Symbiodinium natans]|uniref:Gsp-2 protein n=1 Tax=Symbiodinium natans TaxID=878477 RepID=A0A812QFN4_9DINO|nr:gsp-2 [Symbiodinium natans]